jgi:Tetratricopeptide repeat
LEEAEELGLQVIEIQKRALCELTMLSSMGNLAYTWKGMGRDAEAMRLLEECVQKQKRILGVDHPDTLSPSATLARWKTETVND